MVGVFVCVFGMFLDKHLFSERFTSGFYHDNSDTIDDILTVRSWIWKDEEMYRSY